MSFLETITFTDVLCGQARTTEQGNWLQEIKQTAKYEYNFHDFLSDTLLLLLLLLLSHFSPVRLCMTP